MAKFEELAVRYIPDLIRDFDLHDFQAAGIVGNGGEESAGFTKVQEESPLGGGAGGLGHFQWTGRSSTNNRRLLFEQWLERNKDKGWTPDTYEANYSMLFRELTGTERGALAAVKMTSTLEEATEVFMEKFERPGVPHLDVRIKWARRALEAFKASGIDPHKDDATKLPPTSKLPPLQELFPPLPKIDPATLAPIINALLPVLLQVLNRQGGTSGIGATGIGATQSGQADILSILGPIIQQLAGQPLQLSPPAPTVIVQPPPPPPKPVLEKPSVQLSVAGLGITSILQAIGVVGTPFGMGQDPTLAGTLSTVIPIASAVLGMTGGWGAVAGGVLKVLGPALAGMASAAQKK